jgi:hypothetical protein
MSSGSSSDRQADRLQQLESIEQTIASSLQFAGMYDCADETFDSLSAYYIIIYNKIRVMSFIG